MHCLSIDNCADCDILYHVVLLVNAVSPTTSRGVGTMLNGKQLRGLAKLMEDQGLTPQDPIDQEPFPEGEDRPAGAIDPMTVTDDHCIYNLVTGCGITMPLRDVEGFEDDPLADFNDDSNVRIFEPLE